MKFEKIENIHLLEGIIKENEQELFFNLLKNIKALKKINVDNIKPADFPYELKRSFLWNDNDNYTLDQEDAKKNGEWENNYIVVRTKDKNE